MFMYDEEDNSGITNIWICHHDDDDGIMAGSIFKRYYEKVFRSWIIEIDKIHCIELDYQMSLSDKLKDVQSNDIVIFVDYSFGPKATEQINSLKHLVQNVECYVIWIDHHASSISTVNMPDNEWMKRINGVLNTKYCGAMLSYWWIREKFATNPAIDNIVMGNQLAEIIDTYYQDTPPILKRVDDWDCWKHNLPETKMFHIGFDLSYDSENFTENADKYIYSEEVRGELGEAMVEQIISNGKIIYPADMKRYRFERKAAFECTLLGFEQYRILACNSATFQSSLFGDRIKDYDIVCVFRYNGTKYRYSLYSVNKDIDCSKIAEHFGGGGHKGAAGFDTDELIFIR